MDLAAHEAEFRAFLKQNTAFWYDNTRYPQNQHEYLYVELAHDNPAYLLTNLWVAKYIQKLRGGRLVGLAKGWLKPCPDYDFHLVQELAHSFLVDQVIDLDSVPVDIGEITRRFSTAMESLAGQDLRQAVLNFEADKDEDLGWVLYDTWLRQEFIGSFDRCTPELIECAQSVFHARQAISLAMRGGRALGCVIGHYHYSPYSFIALEAARQGAPVYFQWPLVSVSVRRFASPTDVRQGRAADFLPSYEKYFHSRVNREHLERWQRRMFEIQRGTREYFRTVAGRSTAASRSTFLLEHRLDPKRPVVCFYVPALCAAPHCFGSIPYDDYCDWLRQSLQIARETPEINFLVKRHPQDGLYDRSRFVHSLESAYASADNIRFLETDVSAEQMLQVCDCVAVVNGTPGYEMAARGIATVTAGPSRYSGLGFAREATDLATYRDLLKHAGEQKLSTDQQDRALLFAYFELAAGRSQSLFVPRIRAAHTAEFWREAELNLRSRYVEEDPLFRNLQYMLDHNLPFLLNRDLLDPGEQAGHDDAPVYERSPPDTAESQLIRLAALHALENRAITADRKAAEANEELFQALAFAAALMKTGEVIRFGVGQAGNYLLATGWSHPEREGIWTDGQHAEMLLPWITGDAMLSLECYGIISASSPVRVVELYCNGVRLDTQEFCSSTPVPYTWRVPISATGPRIRITLRIPAPSTVPGDPRLLGLWLSRLWVTPTTSTP